MPSWNCSAPLPRLCSLGADHAGAEAPSVAGVVRALAAAAACQGSKLSPTACVLPTAGPMGRLLQHSSRAVTRPAVCEMPLSQKEPTVFRGNNCCSCCASCFEVVHAQINDAPASLEAHAAESVVEGQKFLPGWAFVPEVQGLQCLSLGPQSLPWTKQ